MIYLSREKMIQIDIGYKLASKQNRRVAKGYSNQNFSALNQLLGISTCLFCSNVVRRSDELSLLTHWAKPS